MYSTNDVGNIAIYGLLMLLFFGFMGLPGVAPVILGLGAIIGTSIMLAKPK